MQNKFGIKDFVLYALIVAMIATVWAHLTAGRRQWEETREALARLKGIEAQVSRLENKLDNGVQASPGVAQAVEETWMAPGIPVLRQPPVRFVSDPNTNPKVAPGGEFTEIWEAQTKVITPFISTDSYSRRVQDLVLEALAGLNPQTLKYQGRLAEAWQVDPDGLWLRARIRSNARFSDGTPVTAEDVRWTFHDFVMNEQIDAERARSILRDSIKEVRALDDRTVEFTFRQRLFTNFDNALSLFVLPKHFYTQFSPAQLNQSTGLLMGSGPFKVQGLSPDRQWTPPNDVVVERNEQYWGPKPALASVRYRGINVEIARLNSFAKGEADIITPAAPQFVAKKADPEWADRAKFLEWINMRSGYNFIAWNCDKRNGKPTPFRDKRARQAMTMLLDREKLISDIYKGIGTVAHGNMPLNSPGCNKDITPWPYDPPKAMALLKELGWMDRDGNGVLEDANGNEFEFEYSYSGGGEIADRTAKFIKDTYTAAGIKVSLKASDWSVYQDLMKKRDFDAITLGWAANGPESDPIQAFHSASIKNEGDNFAQWSCPDADRLIDLGRREIDTDKRMKIWQQLETVLHEEQPYTFLRVPPWLRFVSPNLENVNMYPSGLVAQEFGHAAGGAGSAPTQAN